MSPNNSDRGKLQHKSRLIQPKSALPADICNWQTRNKFRLPINWQTARDGSARTTTMPWNVVLNRIRLAKCKLTLPANDKQPPLLLSPLPCCDAVQRSVNYSPELTKCKREGGVSQLRSWSPSAWFEPQSFRDSVFGFWELWTKVESILKSNAAGNSCKMNELRPAG